MGAQIGLPVAGPISNQPNSIMESGYHVMVMVMDLDWLLVMECSLLRNRVSG